MNLLLSICYTCYLYLSLKVIWEREKVNDKGVIFFIYSIDYWVFIFFVYGFLPLHSLWNEVLALVLLFVLGNLWNGFVWRWWRLLGDGLIMWCGLYMNGNEERRESKGLYEKKMFMVLFVIWEVLYIDDGKGETGVYFFFFFLRNMLIAFH